MKIYIWTGVVSLIITAGLLMNTRIKKKLIHTKKAPFILYLDLQNGFNNPKSKERTVQVEILVNKKMVFEGHVMTNPLTSLAKDLEISVESELVEIEFKCIGIMIVNKLGRNDKVTFNLSETPYVGLDLVPNDFEDEKSFRYNYRTSKEPFGYD